jgi:hypothetical protein
MQPSHDDKKAELNFWTFLNEEYARKRCRIRTKINGWTNGMNLNLKIKTQKQL